MRRTRVDIGFVVLVLMLSACGGGGGGGGGNVTGPPPTGSIAGTVTAASTGVQGAQVSLGTNVQTTDARGEFRFTGVAVGNHTLTLAAPAGFELDAGQTASQSVAVAANQTATVGWVLRRSGGPPPRQVDVQMLEASFDPSSVTVQVGGTVRWVNATATPHTITPSNSSQAGVWQDQNISGAGSTFSHTFNTAGNFEYRCRLHAGMNGTVRVE